MAESSSVWDISVHDQGQSDATSGNRIGGITFGSAGSGKHTTNTGANAGSMPPWLIAAGVVAIAFVLIKKRGK